LYAALIASSTAIVASANIPDPGAGMFESTSTQRLRDYRTIEGNHT
jgi:hypothetical protein